VSIWSGSVTGYYVLFFMLPAAGRTPATGHSVRDR
jgi:hypothetical protein